MPIAAGAIVVDCLLGSAGLGASAFLVEQLEGRGSIAACHGMILQAAVDQLLVQVRAGTSRLLLRPQENLFDGLDDILHWRSPRVLQGDIIANGVAKFDA